MIQEAKQSIRTMNVEDESSSLARAFHHHSDIDRGMKNVLEVDGIPSSAYTSFDEQINEILSDILSDPTIGIYVPHAIKLKSQQPLVNSKLTLPPLSSRFFLPFDNKIVYTDAPFMKEEAVDLQDVRNGTVPEYVHVFEDGTPEFHKHLRSRDIQDVLRRVQSDIERADDLYSGTAKARVDERVAQIDHLVDERGKMKESYRQQYGEALRLQIKELTRLLQEKQIRLPKGYTRADVNGLSSNTQVAVQDIRIDPDDPGLNPFNNNEYYEDCCLWYSWELSNLIMAPHRDSAYYKYEKGPLFSRAQQAPDKMWCAQSGIGYTLYLMHQGSK